MKKLILALVLIGSGIFAACNMLDQEPITNFTNPDKNRGNGQCNEDNDCAPGYRCSSFGSCERCMGC